MSDKEVSEFAKGLSKTNRAFEDRWLTKFSKSLKEVAGAGFHRHICVTILQHPVEVLETLLDGNDVCRIAIHLPRNRCSSSE